MKTLFGKATISALLILLIGIGAITIGLNLMYKNYMVNRNREDLLRLAKIMSERIEAEYIVEGISVDALKREMTNLEIYGDIKVWIMLDKQRVMTTESTFKSNFIFEDLSDSDVERLLSTREPEFRESSYKLYDGSEYYTLIYPKIMPDNKAVILILNKSLPNIYKTIAEINGFAVINIILVFLYASLIIYYSIKRLIDEIKIINRGVKSFTKGNFDVKLNISRSDEIGELSNNLVEMANALQEIEESRRRFVSNVSHDLRSPMTSISGYVNGIIDGTIPEDRHIHYLNIVSDESKRMIKLINDILDLSKFQSATYEISKSDVDLSPVILGVLDALDNRISEKSVSVELNFMERCIVSCDEFLIIRVINNLLDNAVKFVNEGGTISIETKSAGEKVVVAITNTGEPIPKDKLNKIWERFTKLDDSRGEDKKSSGLGLSIVKEILWAHGEKIDVYSSPDSGNTFIFSLEKSKRMREKAD